MNRETRLAQKRDYYYKNRDEILAKMRERQQAMLADEDKRKAYCEHWRLYTRNNYEKRLLASVKSKCTKEGIPFNLDITDIIIPTHCPKTGIPLVIHKERGKYIDTPSIDRIIPANGYVKGNVQIVSYWYNIAKLTWEEQVFIDMCRKVVEING